MSLDALLVSAAAAVAAGLIGCFAVMRRMALAGDALSHVALPGIGFSIGEDRLVMSVEGEQSSVPLDLFIAPLGEAALRQAAIMARDFRRAGLSVELAEGKLKRAMELANKLAARYTLIVGDNELAAGRYTLKNMSTGEQLPLTQDEIAAKLAAARY